MQEILNTIGIGRKKHSLRNTALAAASLVAVGSIAYKYARSNGG